MVHDRPAEPTSIAWTLQCPSGCGTKSLFHGAFGVLEMLP